MPTTIFDISMSLDGYITGPHQTADGPLGKGGEALHEWSMDQDPAGRQELTAAVERYGAVITGRTTYDHSLPSWGVDGPTGGARRPVVVITHQAPEDSPDNGVYEFVTEGIEAALGRATAVAGNGCVCVMGGANVGQQFIQAGMVDEISLHIAPVLFGDGKRLFDRLEAKAIRLEPIHVAESRMATHVRYRVLGIAF
ncbi:MAG: dihydrofolate reductase family protein [Nocardioidaceae bacterium]